MHLNRTIVEQDLNVIYVTGPGHGGPGLVANTYLEGTYSEFYPNIPQTEAGMRRLFTQFSFPGGIPSHVAPETPGSINEGGELGYSLLHAYGAVFDNPDLLACCVIGDGEAETGALATSWHSNKFLNPVRDGAVLPILHLNGYKISGPTVLARIPEEELRQLLVGYGYKPYFVTGHEPAAMHQLMAQTLDTVIAEIRAIQLQAREGGFKQRPAWPMIVLRSPKGWTGPKVVDGLPVEGTFRAHQVPLDGVRSNPEHLRMLQEWMQSYRPGELFDADGRLHADIAALAPKGTRRMGANPHANGGLLLRDLILPDFRDYAVDVPAPGAVEGEATRVTGAFLRDVMRLNAGTKNFRVMGPDETNSNRLGALFEVTNRESTAEIVPGDDHVAPDGRVMEVLSEHMCQGWLEGYLLTGRHGFFSCYEAFIHIIDSMFNQHAKWVKTTLTIPWRRPIASLNYLLTSHVWRQDHNGFSHQDPGFIDHVANKKADVVRIYLPPDANTLLSVTDHCLRSRNYINVIVAGKQPEAQWLDIEAAVRHCTVGLGIWTWASNDDGVEPDVVMACCGDVPTLETLAAVDLLRTHLPDLRDPRGQRGRPDDAAAEHRTPARDFRLGVQLDFYPRQAGDLRVPRLSVAGAPARLPAQQRRPHPCARLQGGGHHHHAVRHDGAQRSRPFPSRRRRARPGAAAGRHRRTRQADAARQAGGTPDLRGQARRGHAGGAGVALERGAPAGWLISAAPYCLRQPTACSIPIKRYSSR